MKCIICLQDRAGSTEHIIPKSIGGTITTGRVCVSCNSLLGAKVDSGLADNFLVRMRRAELGLAGNSGNVPHLAEPLLGVGQLAENPAIKVSVSFNAVNDKLDVRAMPYIADAIFDDGSLGAWVTVDERDQTRLPDLIDRAARRNNKKPGSIRRKQLRVVQNPKIIMQRSYDFGGLSLAFAKIAYEVAFVWLGEAYLDDCLGDRFRRVLVAADRDGADRLPVTISNPDDDSALPYWSPDRTHHIILMDQFHDSIVVCIRIFDLFEAIIWVSSNAERYASAESYSGWRRFIAINASGGKPYETSLDEEFMRIASEVIKRRREE
jgi:hypothetical protein